MIKKLCALAILGLIASPAAVFAQATCATAVSLGGGGQSFSGDTTAGTADIDAVGPLGLNGSPSTKYSFTAGTTVDGTLTLTGATFPWAIYVASNCQASASLVDAIAHNDSPNTLPLSRDSFTAGSTYYVIIGASSGDGSNTSAGPYTLVTTATLPVTLKNFSID